MNGPSVGRCGRCTGKVTQGGTRYFCPDCQRWYHRDCARLSGHDIEAEKGGCKGGKLR